MQHSVCSWMGGKDTGPLLSHLPATEHSSNSSAAELFGAERGEHWLCCFLVQELGLTCTKHLSCCDPDILSALIPPAPWEMVFLLLAALCLSLLGKPNQKFSRILPLPPSPCPSLTSNHIFIFLDKMLSFIYQLLFPSFFSFDYFSRSCLEALTITDVQNSQIQSNSVVFWFFCCTLILKCLWQVNIFYVRCLS